MAFISDADRRSAIKLLDQGYSPRQIARGLSVSRHAVREVEQAHYLQIKSQGSWCTMSLEDKVGSVSMLLFVALYVWRPEPGILFRLLGWE